MGSKKFRYQYNMSFLPFLSNIVRQTDGAEILYDKEKYKKGGMRLCTNLFFMSISRRSNRHVSAPFAEANVMHPVLSVFAVKGGMPNDHDGTEPLLRRVSGTFAKPPEAPPEDFGCLPGSGGNLAPETPDCRTDTDSHPNE